MKCGKTSNGYEGYYKISDNGRVKSLPRTIRRKRPFKTKEKILNPQKNSRGYLRICLKVNGKQKRVFVHRLVAEHFVPKPDGCNIVNHLDCNPLNNCKNNLEWTTTRGNFEYMKSLGRNKRTEKWLDKLTCSERKLFAKKVIRCINKYERNYKI